MKKFSKLSIPYLIWMILLVMIPIAILIVMAFQKTNGIKIFEGKLDFNNFKVLATPKVIESLWLSFLYSLVAISLQEHTFIIAFWSYLFWFFLCGRILYLEQKQLLVYLWKGILFHLCLQKLG